MSDIITGIATALTVATRLRAINKNINNAEINDLLADLSIELSTTRVQIADLLDQNRLLKEKLVEKNDWKERADEYVLVETKGGAVVREFVGDGISHYACPSCSEKREIHILQDCKVFTGEFKCPNCKAEYPVKEKNKPKHRNMVSKGSEWS